MNDPTLNTDTENRSPQILQEEEVLEDKAFHMTAIRSYEVNSLPISLSLQ